jgi:antitoxin MazE
MVMHLLKQLAKLTMLWFCSSVRQVAMMSVQILKKWGNSTAVRIPAALMESAKLAVNQSVEVRAENGRLIIEPAVGHPTLADMVASITPENCHAEVDFGQAKGTELL